MEVSVRELKSQLSHYLRLLESGEAITVTSHRKPIARLSPIGSEKIHALAAIEGISWNGKKPTGGRQRPVVEGKTAAERVLEDRR